MANGDTELNVSGDRKRPWYGNWSGHIGSLVVTAIVALCAGWITAWTTILDHNHTIAANTGGVKELRDAIRQHSMEFRQFKDNNNFLTSATEARLLKDIDHCRNAVDSLRSAQSACREEMSGIRAYVDFYLHRKQSP